VVASPSSSLGADGEKISPLTYGVDAILPGRRILGVTVLGHTTTTVEDMLIIGLLGAILPAVAVVSFSRQA